MTIRVIYKKTWKIMKDIINKNKNKLVHSKFKLSDGTYTSDGAIVSNKFNDFFINVGPNLANKKSLNRGYHLFLSWVNL